MSTDSIQRGEYEADWRGHRQVHETVHSRIEQAEADIATAKQLQLDQLAELHDIKLLLIVLIVGSFPRLVEFLRGLWH